MYSIYIQVQYQQKCKNDISASTITTITMAFEVGKEAANFFPLFFIFLQLSLRRWYYIFFLRIFSWLFNLHRHCSTWGRDGKSLKYTAWQWQAVPHCDKKVQKSYWNLDSTILLVYFLSKYKQFNKIKSFCK